MDTTGANGLETIPWDDSEWSDRAAGGGDDIDVEAVLRSLDGIIADADHLCLEPAFRTARRDRIARIRDRNAQLEELAAQLSVDPGRLALAVAADGFEATYDRTRIGLWPSNAAFLADIAVASLLDEREADWDRENWRKLETNEQRAALTALRLFLERCPNCEGALVGSGTEIPTAADSPWWATVDEARTSESPSESGCTVACERCGVVIVREKPYDGSVLVSSVR